MRSRFKTPIVLLFSAAFALLLGGAFSTKIKPESKKVKVVCIDAGHGGKDPGCHGDNYKEKDIALAIALKLGKYITDHYPDINVVYTRTTDVFVELNERAAIANRNHADIFICIHCNSACVHDKKTHRDVCNEEAHGSATYVMGLHKLDGNLDVARRENDAVLYEDDYQKKYDLNINSDEAAIIYSSYQNLYLEQSMRFAQLCQEQFSSVAAREDNGVKQAGFLVLWKTSMPSVLIETGFLSNPVEERFLGSDKGQSHMAASIFRAFRSWKDELEGNNTAKYDDDMTKLAPYVPGESDSSGLRMPVDYVSKMNGGSTQHPKKDTISTVVVQKTDSAPKKDDPPPVVKNDPPPIVKADSSPPQKDPPQHDPPVVKTDSGPHKSDPPVVKTDPPKKDSVSNAGAAVYRVQFYLSDKLIPDNSPALKGVKDVWHYEQNGSYKYTSGTFSTVADAVQRKNELAGNGFPQSFVVAFDSKGNRITIDQAKALNGGK